MSDHTNATTGWAIDTSTGRDILTYEKCSVIEDEQAHKVMALLAGPTDAAVREAVEHAENASPWGKTYPRSAFLLVDSKHIRTLLRAVQSPRLTEEQEHVLRGVGVMLLLDWGTPQAHAIVDSLRAAFPGVLGKEG